MADLRWIEDFLDLAATRNFTQTADNRFVTQPTLSRRIQHLEHWLGSTLFDRSSNPIQLTSDGERFVPAARDILRLAGKLSLRAGAYDIPPEVNDSPAAPASETGKGQPTKQEDISAEAGHKSDRIVIVDDSPVSVEIFTHFIENMGYEPITFTDGQEALQSLANTPASILFTDCEMPDFDGYELAQAIRNAERESNRHTPIIAVTGHSSLEEINRCFDVGMDDYLYKPVGSDELEVIIARWLNPDDSVEGIENAWLATAIPENSSARDAAADLVRTFCARIRERVTEIAALVDQGANQRVAALLPSIKSEAFMIGAYSFGRACGQFQQAAIARDFPLMLEKVGPFLGSFVKLERAVRIDP